MLYVPSRKLWLVVVFMTPAPSVWHALLSSFKATRTCESSITAESDLSWKCQSQIKSKWVIFSWSRLGWRTPVLNIHSLWLIFCCGCVFRKFGLQSYGTELSTASHLSPFFFIHLIPDNNKQSLDAHLSSQMLTCQKKLSLLDTNINLLDLI